MIAFGAIFGTFSAGCNSFRNGWLDPTVLGEFTQTATLEIRTSLTLEDTPLGIPGAVYPSPEDIEIIYEDYPISAGDSLAIEIFELRERRMPFQAQIQVTPRGYVNLPTVGEVKATGMTPSEFELALTDVLRDREILVNPEVTVNPLMLQKATYSIFGIGVSASNNAPLRAGTFPIRRPDLRVLEAINQVGGLNEFVTEVYIFRTYEKGMFDRSDAGRPDGASTAGKHRTELMQQNLYTNPVVSSQHSQPIDPRKSELFAAVSGVRQPRLVRQDQSKNQKDKKKIPPALQPEPTDAYIYIDGKFVRNPKYKAVTGQEDRGPGNRPRGAMGKMDSPMPAVNWARLAGDTNYRVIVIPADILRGGDPEANIYVRPGDVIRIVSGEIGVYYVMGQVNRVGTYAFNAESITLKAAIAAAGGLGSLAWPDRCTVYRRMGAREQMIQVNLDRIFAGLDSDFLIRRGDIINVGTHPFAPFLQRIRGLTLPNPVANIGYGFTYSRNFADIDSFSVRTNPRNDRDQFPNLFP